MALSEDQREQLVAKAEFCILTGIQPSEYDQLTDDEIDVFIETANRFAEKRE